MMGLFTEGNASVESNGVVIRLLSRTGRMGCACPVDASSVEAALVRSACAFKICSRESEFQQDGSLQEIRELKCACRVVCVAEDKNP